MTLHQRHRCQKQLSIQAEIKLMWNSCDFKPKVSNFGPTYIVYSLVMSHYYYSGLSKNYLYIAVYRSDSIICSRDGHLHASVCEVKLIQ